MGKRLLIQGKEKRILFPFHTIFVKDLYYFRVVCFVNIFLFTLTTFVLNTESSLNILKIFSAKDKIDFIMFQQFIQEYICFIWCEDKIMLNVELIGMLLLIQDSFKNQISIDKFLQTY